MRSRTSRYARFDSRRNQRLAKITGGTITSVQSASCQLRMTMKMIAPTKIKPFWTNATRPCETRSWSASMSAVMRVTSLPVFSFSKKSRPSRNRWRNTRERRSRRNVSPMRATRRITIRPNTQLRSAAAR